MVWRVGAGVPEGASVGACEGSPVPSFSASSPSSSSSVSSIWIGVGEKVASSLTVGCRVGLADGLCVGR